jgi:hypothetical protein
MRLCDFIEKLQAYNQLAEVSVIVHNKREKFSISYGDYEGVTKETAQTIGIYVDSLNGKEY